MNLSQTAALIASGVISFHLAYAFSSCSFLIVVYLYSVAALARQRTSRRAFYFGLAIGLLCYGPQLSCFYNIFGLGAVPLWLVLAFWIAIFGLLARLCLFHFGPRWATVLIPFVWTGLEYFRSELYYLRFSWLNAGYAFSDQVQMVPFGILGVYGLGFLLMGLAAALNFLPMRRCAGSNQARKTPEASDVPAHAGDYRTGQTAKVAFACAALALIGLGVWTSLPASGSNAARARGLSVAGVQMEFPEDRQVIFMLNKLKKLHPEAPLLVLSEYTFTDALPDLVSKWCRDNQRYLIVGGKDLVNETQFFDTAFVIDPKGEIVFRQAKSVPIQFFNDGLPAREQKLWDSPWGKIGICICYDLSYARVTDRLVRLGANALIVPTMDVVDWGRHEHELHARIAPVRAAEYGLPVFRVASSGISQLADSRGAVTASAPFPGEEAPIAGWLDMSRRGRVPLDRLLAQAAAGVTGLVLAWLAMNAAKVKYRARRNTPR